MSHSKERSTFAIVVIGEAGGLRNPELESQLSNFEFSYSSPVFLSADSDLDEFTDQSANRVLFGRDLLNGEVGCALAHEKARRGSNSDWLMVLEDDVNLEPSIIGEVISLVKGLSTDIPTIISLFDEAQLAGKEGIFRRLPYPPSCNTAYVANFAANQIKADKFVGTADWPLHMQDLAYFSYWTSRVGIVHSPSRVDPTGQRLVESRVKEGKGSLSIGVVPLGQLMRFRVSSAMRDFHRQLRIRKLLL